LDNKKNKKITDWHAHHLHLIERWDNTAANVVPHGVEHNKTYFDEYLAWLLRNYRLFLWPAWTLADIATDPEDVEEMNEYDTHTRARATVEYGPIRDRVVSIKAQSCSFHITPTCSHNIKSTCRHVS
jgi:hypothetical protein